MIDRHRVQIFNLDDLDAAQAGGHKLAEQVNLLLAGNPANEIGLALSYCISVYLSGFPKDVRRDAFDVFIAPSLHLSEVVEQMTWGPGGNPFNNVPKSERGDA